MHPHIDCALSFLLSVESSGSLHHKKTSWDVEVGICGCDDHLARKHLISSASCKRLRTTGG